MEKIKVEKKIFWEHKNTPFKWKDIKHLELEDEDIINLSYVEPYHSENESYDGHFEGEIIRMVEETDEQFEKRKKREEEDKERARQRRYETYLKFKKEFGDVEDN